jgi:hypothetical protein
MVPLLSLWLPIVAGAVAVFVTSTLVHMVLRWHAGDYRQLPREDEVRALLRGAGVTPGFYHFPWGRSPQEMGTPEMKARFVEGPVGMLTIVPSGPIRMGRHLLLWFLYAVLVGVFTAYVTGRALAPGADFREVFRFAGATALMAYGLGPVVDSIWKGQRWGATAKNVADGVLYSLAMAAAFGWLWPR